MAVKKPLALYNGVIQEVGSGDSLSVSGLPTTFSVSVQTATASQTVFSIAYTVGYIEVYQNGVRLAPDEFTATNGTSVTLATAATLGDEIMFVVYTVLVTGAALVPADIGVSVQGLLVSGTSIKTVNSVSLLGSGDISVGDKFAAERAVRRGRQFISQ